VTVDYRANPLVGERERSQLEAVFAPGRVLDRRYVLERELGRGGMGQVYLARDNRLDRPVAVKVICRKDELVETGLEDTMRTAFVDEARLGANLTHPGIATVYDFGFHEDQPYTVFEYIPGETLRSLLRRRGRIPLEEVRLILGPLAQALDFAHARHIVHRDLKPENIRATEQGPFKILDLGLAKDFCRQADWRFAGTPAYASPEQAADLPCDGRTDQYALALIVFEMLACRRLFVESDPWKLLELHRSQEPDYPPDWLPELPQEIHAALRRALSKDPAARFGSCEELALALGCQFLSAPGPKPQILRFAALQGMAGHWRNAQLRVSRRLGAPYLMLGPEHLWGVYRGEMMCWPLQTITSCERKGKRISLRFATSGDSLRQVFTFADRSECQAWLEQIETLRKNLDLKDNKSVEEPRIEPVVLLQQRPQVRLQLLGPVEYSSTRRARAEAGLQVAAAQMGADAVIDVQEERLPSFADSQWRLSGTAVRAVDQDGRRELRSRWFSRQVATISRWMLVLVGVSFVGSVVASFYVSFVGLLTQAPLVQGHDIPRQAAVILGVLALIHAFPLVLALLLRWLCWPQLLRPAAGTLMALAARPIPASLGWVSAASVTGKWWAVAGIAFPLLDPVNLALLFFSFFIARRAWRAYGEFRALVPGGDSCVPLMRRMVAGTAIGGAICFAVALTAWQGWASYEYVSAIRSIGDAQKEAIALREFNDAGARLATQPLEAERLYRKILPVWNELALSSPSMPHYRQNVAATHLNLGIVLLNLNQLAEAEELLMAAETRYEKLTTEDAANAIYRNDLANTRKVLALVRQTRAGLGQDPLMRASQLQLSGRYQEAEKVYGGVVAQCEEQRAKDPEKLDVRKRLAVSYHGLAQVLAIQGKTQAAIDAYEQTIAIAENLVRDLAQPLNVQLQLGYAKNGLAWLLATCSDTSLRNPTRAVELAHAALKLSSNREGGFWNTLGAAQYRAGSWNESIQALQKSMELRDGGDALDWFFLAMAHHQLGQHAEARKWLTKGVQAVDQLDRDRTNSAPNEARREELLRLRQEAESLPDKR
jgi:serine/threonine-protein kinase